MKLYFSYKKSLKKKISQLFSEDTKPERIYNPIMAIGFSAMFTFQLDNTKRQTLTAPHCRNGSCRYVRARPGPWLNFEIKETAGLAGMLVKWPPLRLACQKSNVANLRNTSSKMPGCNIIALT